MGKLQVFEKSTVKSFYETVFRAVSKSGVYIRYESSEKFDYVIYGSDQIWRKQMIFRMLATIGGILGVIILLLHEK